MMQTLDVTNPIRGGLRPIHHPCPNCDSQQMSQFYDVAQIPAYDVVLLASREEALNAHKGDLSLAWCPKCGFISNIAFDESLPGYASGLYESTQRFSPTFNSFAHRLATRLVEQYDLHGKTIIEIGCGQGEFLEQLCEIGGNRGIGFDPAYAINQRDAVISDKITFIADFYGEKYSDYHADFVCCKMTLEHIPQTEDFIRIVRKSVGDDPNTLVFFQVPNALHVLQNNVLWDIYYEHCSYFSMGSLARLFRRCGFDVLALSSDYDDQYIMIEARPGTGSGTPPLPQEDDLDAIKQTVEDFTASYPVTIARWQTLLRESKQAGRKVVVWGGGSKAVAFLTTLGVTDEIAYAVDINPYKSGTFIAGAGQEIVAPQFLLSYRPDLVIVMNPIYIDEVRSMLENMGIDAEVIPS